MKQNQNRLMDLVDKRFGRLLVIRRAPDRPNEPYRPYWRCRCDCGKTVTIRGECLRIGFTKSCGCLRVDNGIKRGRASLKHGYSHAIEYAVWANMKDRCLNPNCPSFKNYGARGITVCKRWLEYEN